jgi:WD40 repeat protein
VAVSADSQLVASASTDGTVRLWEAATGQPGAILRGHTGEVHAVALSGDGRVVASGGMDGTVRRWDAGSGQPLAVLPGAIGAVWGVGLSGDGLLLASGGFDGNVRVWDLPGGTLRHALRGERLYEALDITGLTGVTDAQRQTLFALGAVERIGQTTPSS